MPNVYVSKIQDIIKAGNPDINITTGSPLYFLLATPAGGVFESVQNEIDTINRESSLLTATDKDPLLANFGISRTIGKPGIGKVKIIAISGLPLYEFPKGTILEHISGTNVKTMEYCSIPASKGIYTVEVPVETVGNVSKTYLPDDSFTNDTYGTLIKSISVSTTIGGGMEDETDAQLMENILEKISGNIYTVSGMKKHINAMYTSIVDTAIDIPSPGKLVPDDMYELSAYNVTQKKGIVVNAFVKTYPKKISVQNVTEIRDTILRFLSPVPTHYKENVGTAYERRLFSSPINVDYYAAQNLSDIQSALDNDETSPIGIRTIVMAASPVFVSGEIMVRDMTGNLQDYITNHGMFPLNIGKMINENGLNGYVLPISLKCYDVYKNLSYYVSNEDTNINKAYYYDGIKTVKV